MKRRICGRSMVLGAVIMLIGLAVGAIVSPPLIAQHNGVFGEIQCTKLTVVDNMGKTAVELDSHEEAGNSVTVNNKQGNSAVILRSSELGNIVFLANKQGNSAIVLLSHEDWGNLASIYNNQGKTAVELGRSEYGGRVDVFNNQGKTRAVMGVNEYGNGAVSTWDKNGYRQ